MDPGATKLELLKGTESLHDLAALLGYTAKGMAYVLYGQSDDKKYTQFELPKRSGGTRVISAPHPQLKLIQKRLSILLQDCISDINEQRGIRQTLAHGFKRRKSIITNSAAHRNKRYVFNVDLIDFFGSINFGRVRGFFIKNANFTLSPDVATIIAKIACHENTLPQGSPCSPVISNLIGHVLDIRLARLASKRQCVYSRYADDITFSTNRCSFPPAIARETTEGDHDWIPGNKLDEMVTKAGFAINASKTRMQYRDSRQDVTGLVVNRKINIRSEYWRAARAMAHSLFKTGEFTIPPAVRHQGSEPESEEKGTIEQLEGMLSFIDSVDLFNKKRQMEVMKDKMERRKVFRSLGCREKVYAQLRFYKNFYAPALPTILCEGKTDSIYLKAAIRNIKGDFPEISESKKGGEKVLKLNFFKYTEAGDRLLGLGGGVQDMKTFIQDYAKRAADFNAGQKHPVIVLIDNDGEAKRIFSYIQQKKKLKYVDGGDPFYYLIENLYVVAIPKIGDAPTIIEDYFEKKVLNTKHRGKTFSSKTPFDGNKEYGKTVFAEQVVWKNQSKINFEKFSAILKRIELAIKDYRQRVGA